MYGQRDNPLWLWCAVNVAAAAAAAIGVGVASVAVNIGVDVDVGLRLVIKCSTLKQQELMSTSTLSDKRWVNYMVIN